MLQKTQEMVRPTNPSEAWIGRYDGCLTGVG